MHFLELFFDCQFTKKKLLTDQRFFRSGDDKVRKRFFKVTKKITEVIKETTS